MNSQQKSKQWSLAMPAASKYQRKASATLEIPDKTMPQKSYCSLMKLAQYKSMITRVNK
jgi:hypothetical protein